MNLLTFKFTIASKIHLNPRSLYNSLILIVTIKSYNNFQGKQHIKDRISRFWYLEFATLRHLFTDDITLCTKAGSMIGRLSLRIYLVK